jgi:hypothetical protein
MAEYVLFVVNTVGDYFVPDPLRGTRFELIDLPRRTRVERVAPNSNILRRRRVQNRRTSNRQRAQTVEQRRRNHRRSRDRLADNVLQGSDSIFSSEGADQFDPDEETELEIVEELPVWVGCEPDSLMGTYDPFNRYFPLNQFEVDWGLRAAAWIAENLSKEEDWDRMMEVLWEPFDPDDSDFAFRTMAWFGALEFDVQVEILLQRHFELRPGSKWIIGPHEDLLDQWEWKITHGQCRILDIEYPGCEGGFVIAHEMNPGTDLSRYRERRVET